MNCGLSYIFPGSLAVVCFTDGALSLSVPPDEDRLRNKQRKELHRRGGSLPGQCQKFPYCFRYFCVIARDKILD